MSPFSRLQIAACPLLLAAVLGFNSRAMAGISIAPYASIKSTKSIQPNATDKTQENAKVKQRQEYGLRGSLTFFKLLGVQLSVGQSVLTTTQKTQVAVDEYAQIDYKKDLNMDTNDPSREIKITETQRVAKLGVSVDPSFSIFIMRAKAGVSATQRLLVSQVTGQEQVSKTFGPTYKPYAGVGAGVRFNPRFYFMAEYTFDYYQFPKFAPFQREATASFNVEL